MRLEVDPDAIHAVAVSLEDGSTIYAVAGASEEKADSKLLTPLLGGTRRAESLHPRLLRMKGEEGNPSSPLQMIQGRRGSPPSLGTFDRGAPQLESTLPSHPNDRGESSVGSTRTRRRSTSGELRR